jgi:3-oxoacyl-[acyl-carrier-protein] synthase II
MKRRVVVTGLGIVSPLGTGMDTVWANLTAGQSGIRKIAHFKIDDMPSQIAGYVPLPGYDGYNTHGFNPDTTMEPKDQRKVDPFIVFGMGAADEALRDAGWAPQTEDEKCRTGVLIGSGIGGLQSVYEASVTLHEKGPRRLSPFTVPMMLINLASGQVSIKHGLKGPNHSVVTACATGTHAIGDAARLIAFGDADVMVAGGAEAAVNRLGVGSFAAARALCTTYNDRPTEASRPFDDARDGFVIGEGAGVVVLEEYDHAVKRGAKIYAEVIGYGLSGDAHHITAPADDGDGGFRAMTAALKNAGITPDQVDYINAHGTSTQLGDSIECGAVKRLFAGALDRVSMSSTKSAIGHLLGAAGAVEAIFAIKAIQTGVMPPTLNLTNPSQGCQGIDLVPLVARQKDVRIALSNSFGFGGTNASVIFRAV